VVIRRFFVSGTGLYGSGDVAIQVSLKKIKIQTRIEGKASNDGE